MPLPTPLPDDPKKWDGWSRFGSDDLYERLGFSPNESPTEAQIEENSRALLVWWQKKLPLRAQPSNPMAQLLRAGLDAAAKRIAEARAELLNPERRAEVDRLLSERRRAAGVAQLGKYLAFALADKVLTHEAEAQLYQVGRELGLRGEDVARQIHEGLLSAGAAREAATLPPAPVPPPSEPVKKQGAPNRFRPVKKGTVRFKASAISPAEERRRYPDFVNGIGSRMLLIPAGKFLMGRQTPEAPLEEQPSNAVTLTRFYLAKHPVTNAQYELFDAEHLIWRSPGAGDDHPAVYVSHFEAEQYCAWLSEQENRRYRLPTEAEWEYSARGTDGRIYPWPSRAKISLTRLRPAAPSAQLVGAGSQPALSPLWKEASGAIEGGPNEAEAVGQHPEQASPFGVEDLSGNVWEWCRDWYGSYGGIDRVDPSGAENGLERVCRGGSWKTPDRQQSTSRGSRPPTYAAVDVGFRVMCECPAIQSSSVQG